VSLHQRRKGESELYNSDAIGSLGGHVNFQKLTLIAELQTSVLCKTKEYTQTLK